MLNVGISVSYYCFNIWSFAWGVGRAPKAASIQASTEKEVFCYKVEFQARLWPGSFPLGRRKVETASKMIILEF